jgi:hypothetical protein
VLVVGLLSLVALVYLLTNFPMLVAAAMGLIAFVAAVIFSRRIREQQEQRDWTEAQAARQPALVPAQELPREPAPQSVPQAEWTTECDTAVAALVCLRILKCESIALVLQSAGTTADEITRNALRIRGKGRGRVPNCLMVMLLFRTLQLRPPRFP